MAASGGRFSFVLHILGKLSGIKSRELGQMQIHLKDDLLLIVTDAIMDPPPPWFVLDVISSVRRRYETFGEPRWAVYEGHPFAFYWMLLLGFSDGSIVLYGRPRAASAFVCYKVTPHDVIHCLVKKYQRAFPQELLDFLKNMWSSELSVGLQCNENDKELSNSKGD